MPSHYRFDKQTVLDAIDGSMGIISTVARRLGGIGWHTAKRQIERWQETRAAWQNEIEKQLDFAETELLKLIGSGDGPSIRFYLATKGASRGYVERREITGAGGGAILLKTVEFVGAGEDDSDGVAGDSEHNTDSVQP